MHFFGEPLGELKLEIKLQEAKRGRGGKICQLRWRRAGRAKIRKQVIPKQRPCCF